MTLLTRLVLECVQVWHFASWIVDYSESTYGSNWTSFPPQILYLASPKLYPQYAEDEDNILYSANISEKYVGMYFVSFNGTENVKFDDSTYIMDKGTVAFEIPNFPKCEKYRIRCKRGCSLKATHVHVKSHKMFKCFLDLKYLETMANWDAKGFKYSYHLDSDKNTILAELDRLSALRATITSFKCFGCVTKNNSANLSFVSEGAWRKHLWRAHDEIFESYEEYCALEEESGRWQR